MHEDQDPAAPIGPLGLAITPAHRRAVLRPRYDFDRHRQLDALRVPVDLQDQRIVTRCVRVRPRVEMNAVPVGRHVGDVAVRGRRRHSGPGRVPARHRHSTRVVRPQFDLRVIAGRLAAGCAFAGRRAGRRAHAQADRQRHATYDGQSLQGAEVNAGLAQSATDNRQRRLRAGPSGREEVKVRSFGSSITVRNGRR
jgi:hypothetical protein